MKIHFKNLLKISFLFLIGHTVSAWSFTQLFYTMRDNDIPYLRDHYRVMNDLKQHHSAIDILVPQAYVIHSSGMIYKFVEPQLKQAARHYHIKLMPLVTNENFDSKKLTAFLKNPLAQQRAIQTLAGICKAEHYDGMQIDFEHIPDTDGDAFTQFYQKTSAALHQAGCKISIAIVPERHKLPVSSILLKRHLYWTSAYHQKALAKASDFVVLMTYNQHGGMTTPGPNASYTLDKKAIQYALHSIPKQKIFLGIPTSSNYWSIAPNNNRFPNLKNASNDRALSPEVARSTGISYQQTQLLKKMHHLQWQWDKKAKVHYSIFSYQDFYHYLFLEDASSYSAKVQLAKHYHLGGIAVFRLGTEDPAIFSTHS